VSSDTALTYEQLTRLYQRRWTVDEFHTSLKQHMEFSMGVHVSSLASWRATTDRESDAEWERRERDWPPSRHLERYRRGRPQKKEPAEVNVAYADFLNTRASCGIEVELRTEADEFWSDVEKKSNQRGTWYAIDRSNGVLLAHQKGRRTDERCEQLLAKLDIFPITAYYTDDWQSYSKYIPDEQHYLGKQDTWKIERTKLNFRIELSDTSETVISKNDLFF
jgi:insertion element IS1 protein InsB